MWGLQSIPGHIRPPCEGCACQGGSQARSASSRLLLPMRPRVLERPTPYPSPGDRWGRVCRELAQESKDTLNNRLSCWLIALRCYLQGWGVFRWLWSISPPLRLSLFPAPLVGLPLLGPGSWWTINTFIPTSYRKLVTARCLHLMFLPSPCNITCTWLKLDIYLLINYAC